jgi:hypothetical protein
MTLRRETVTSMGKRGVHSLAVVGLVMSAGLLLAMALRTGTTAAASKSDSATAASYAVWTQACKFSHRNQDDPIVFPGQPRRSHDHTYFGNRSANAASTPGSLRQNLRTTCGERADKSAYWVPTLFVDGRAVEPLGVVTRYLRRTYEPVEPFPARLKVIAGSAHARTNQSMRATSWSCAVPGSQRSRSVPTCPGGRSGLILRVAFPDCWNGDRLDSPNHKSHMAYSTEGVCPQSHSVELPALVLFVVYRVSGGRTTELSSGGQASGHADFVNAWNQAKLSALMHRYLNAPDAIGPPLGPPDPTIWPPCETCTGHEDVSPTD